MISMDISKYRNRLEQRKAERLLIKSRIEDLDESLGTLTMFRDDAIKARWVMTEVARITQEKFKDRIETLVTMAIQAVFDRPFYFIVNSTINRNKTECQLLVKEGIDAEPFVPKDEMGGGLLDVISLALRVVLWSMERPRSNNVFLLGVS